MAVTFHNVQLRTAHNDESIVRQLGFHREKSKALEDRFSIFS